MKSIVSIKTPELHLFNKFEICNVILQSQITTVPLKVKQKQLFSFVICTICAN